jgi:putative membrane protein
LWLLAGFYVVLWGGGLVAYVFRGGPDPADWWTAPLFLALAALLVAVTSPARLRPWLGLALLLGFLSELIGVRTGWPFGVYEYTAALRPAVLGVPVVISMAWMVLVAFVHQALLRGGWRGWPAVAGGSAAMLAIDLVVDPVAAGMR